MTSAFFPGFFLSLSLILAIGAQNAFVLRQGLRQEHVFAVCLVCAVSDAVLIAAGVAGFGLASNALPWLEPVLRYGGALFLLTYAARSFRSARRNHGSLTPSSRQAAGLGATLATCLAFTWLNPHVYLDTVVLLGSLANQHGPDARWVFAAGAVAASVLWFTALGYGARLLARVLADPKAWRVVDVVIAVVMAVLAVRLIAGSGVWG